MSANEAALDRARLAAKKYFNDLDGLPPKQLIGRLEDTAYQLARAGQASGAKSLFIAVADLELTQWDHDSLFGQK